MSITRLADPSDVYLRFEKVPAPAPDTRTSAGESVRTLTAEQGESPRPLDLDPTLDAWDVINAGARVFQHAIRHAVTVAELVQLRERADVLSQIFADLSDTAGRRADQVIARRP